MLQAFKNREFPVTKRSLANAALCGVLSVGLAFSLGAAPTSAYADDQSAISSWSNALKETAAKDYSPYSSEGSSSASSSSNVSGITHLDLRDPDGNGDRSDSVVTSVKLQSPWETCWAFAATAASETSIFSELRKAGSSSQVDLSELYLAWFSHALTTQASVGSAQAGEGLDRNGGTDSYILKMGGYPNYAATLFSSGSGAVSESVAPYKNKEGKITCKVLSPGAESDEEKDLTEEEIAALPEGTQVTRLHWAENTFVEGENGTGHYEFYDWTVSESLRGTTEYQLEESYQLPNVNKFDDQGNYLGLSQEGMNAVKEQLLAGRGVATASFTEAVDRESASRATIFNYDTWAEYAQVSDKSNHPVHAITIVGWDDNYSSENFLESKQPSGNGAWLVKNSWGCSSTEEFPDEWGIQEDGEYTGYFWLSYYDETIQNLVAFDFDVNSSTSEESFIHDQYDYLPQDTVAVNASDEKASSANEFTAGEDRVLRALTCQTAKPNTQVTYEVYLLNNESSSPTDGKLVLTKNETYEYGGFHRLMLSGEEQVAMREGQRYSVVVTQKCGDKYYQVTTRNNNYGISRYGQWVSKINEGESWTLSNGAWSDWNTVSKAAVEESKSDEAQYVVDNFPIKGLATQKSWASVDELSALESAIAKAKDALASAHISVDGSDVPEGETWMTQEQYDELSAAVAQAEEQFSLAGADYATTLANTTPSSSTVNAAVDSLAFTAQYGTATFVPEVVSAADENGANAPASHSELARTSDTALPAVALLAASLAAAVVAVAVRRRTRQR